MITPDGIIDGKSRRIASVVVIACFILMLAGTGLVDIISPVPLPELVGREKREEERLREEANWADGSLARLIEREARLTSRVRTTLRPSYALALYRWLNDGQGRVYVGSGGWLFNKNRVQVRAEPDSAVVGYAASVVSVVNRRLAALGTELVTAPVPRKSVVEQDLLPRGVDPQARLYSQYVGKARGLGIQTVDLLTAFERADVDRLFFKADTHWNDHGMIIAAEEICREAGLLAPAEQRKTKIVETERPRIEPTDLIRFLGFNEEAAAKLKRSAVGYKLIDERGKSIRLLPTVQWARVGLVGTSFSRAGLGPYIFHFSDQTLLEKFIRGGGPTGAMSELLRAGQSAGLPDILVWEIPAHYFFWENPLYGFSDWFAEFPPPQTRELSTQGWVQTSPKTQKEFVLGRRWQDIASINTGHFIHPGDGTVGIRLRGEANGSIEVRSISDSLEVNTSWPKGKKMVIAPVLGHQPVLETSLQIRSARGQVRLKLDAVDLVDDLDIELAIRPQLTDVQRIEDGWQQTAEFIEPIDIERAATLELQLDVQGSFDGRISVEILAPKHSPNSDRQDYLGINSEATILMNLGSHYGKKLSSIVVRGYGPPPSSAVRAIAVIPIAKSLQTRTESPRSEEAESTVSG